MIDYCLQCSKFTGRKMLDLQKKYAIISNIFQVQHQARNRAFQKVAKSDDSLQTSSILDNRV